MAAPHKSPVIDAVASALVSVQQVTDSNWAALLLGTTLVTRTAVSLPLAVYQQTTLGKLELLKPEMKEWTEALKYKVTVVCRRDGKSLEEAQTMLQKEVR